MSKKLHENWVVKNIYPPSPSRGEGKYADLMTNTAYITPGMNRLVRAR